MGFRVFLRRIVTRVGAPLPALAAGLAPLLVFATLLPVSTAPAHAAGPCALTAAEVALDVEEKAFLTQINNYRVANGRTPLKISYFLTKASAWKSKDLGVNAYFAHDDTPIGRTWYQRVQDCGYTYGTAAGENIAAGYTTAAQVFAGWQASSGHNANMLSTSYTAIGIGRHYVAGSPYGWYWTTNFGGVDDGWYNAPESVTAISGDIEPLGWAPAGFLASSVVGVIHIPPSAPGGGAQPRALDFSRLCDALLARQHPLADRFCRPQ